jgi:hypothetical protein
MAVTNIAGELYDLQSNDDLDEGVDPAEIAERISTRYEQLWRALTETETLTSNIPLHVADRVRELNEMGFDVGEIDMQQTGDGTALTIKPKVVDAGHHSRRLMRLTGLDVQENQARRLLNDLDEYRSIHPESGDDENYAAHQWLRHIISPSPNVCPNQSPSQ